MEHPRGVHIVDEATESPEQPWILVTRDPRPDAARRHRLAGTRPGRGAGRGRPQRLEGAIEAEARRLDEAGADLADAGLAMSPARVDLRKNAGLRDEPYVDPSGSAAKVERRQPVGRALGQRPLLP